MKELFVTFFAENPLQLTFGFLMFSGGSTGNIEKKTVKLNPYKIHLDYYISETILEMPSFFIEYFHALIKHVAIQAIKTEEWS